MKRFLLLFLALVTLVSAFASEIEIVEVRDSTWSERYLGNGFSIFTDKSTYQSNEFAKIDEYQDISAYCNALEVKISLFHPTGELAQSTGKSLGAAGWMTAYVSAKFVIPKEYEGKYKVTTEWICDGVKLGKDGYKDSNTEGSVSYFNIVKATSTPPVQSCSKQCSTGYKLVNPSSVDCFCEAAYKLNDGTCSIGEPVASVDCKVQEETPDEPIKEDSWLLYAGVAVVLVIGGLIAMRK